MLCIKRDRYRKDGSMRYSLCELGKFPASKEIVDGHSMEPTLHHGDIVTIVSYKMFKPRIDRGDIVVCKHPTKASVIIKRCIAVPGDYVKSMGFQSQTAVIPANMWKKGAGRMGFHKLKDDEIYVQGDNIKNSGDSRYFGPLKMRNLLGVVIKVRHKDRTREKLYGVHQFINTKCFQDEE